jgi:hypothetical protein
MTIVRRSNPLTLARVAARASVAVLLLQPQPAAQAQTEARTVFVGSAAKPAGLKAVVQSFRVALGGPDHGGEPGPFAGGRREITWDQVPDELASPNVLPGDIFDGTEAPFARGVRLSTPGESIQVSADSNNPDGALPRFGHVNPSYTQTFKTFSAERLFSPVGGSNLVDVTFRKPGTGEEATVRGFGAVYIDVDRAKSSFEFYDAQDRLIGTFKVPAKNGGFSFLGVIYDQPVVARVRIRYGTHALGPRDDAGHDVAVMDNFLYDEPQALP